MEERIRIDKERRLLDGAGELLDELPKTLIFRDLVSTTGYWKDEILTLEVLRELLRERFHTEMEYKDYADDPNWSDDPNKMRLLDYVYENGQTKCKT